MNTDESLRSPDMIDKKRQNRLLRNAKESIVRNTLISLYKGLQQLAERQIR